MIRAAGRTRLVGWEDVWLSLTLEAVEKRFGATRAVADLTLEIAAGATFGLIGPNGAGKTTTMRLILSILDPDRGRVLWRGRPVGEWPRSGFGYLPEERGLFPRMRVREQIAFFGELHGLFRTEARARTDRWIERLQLQPHADKTASSLSKGNAQKAQLAIALLCAPELVILDEPFSGLDPVNVQLLKGVIRDAAGEGRTLIFSSHRMDHVEELCKGVALIDHGRVSVAGAVEDVRRASGRLHVRVGYVPGTPEAAYAQLQARLGLGDPVRSAGDFREYALAAGQAPPVEALLAAVSVCGTPQVFAVVPPSLEDIYVQRVGAHPPEEGAEAVRPERRRRGGWRR